ncbi:MAG: PAS domain S-box protein [candidate division KSB1 bacterium]|nr:PAS domain S-box protein [candidate division KSB1 bacterium]
MVPQLRIVLVDDNPDDRFLLIRELRREFGQVEVEQVIGPEEFAAALDCAAFDLVITDYKLQWADGLAILREVKRRCPDKPVIMFTATGSEEIAVEAMKAGLDDYILKSPKHFARVPAAVRLVLERAAQRRLLVEAETRYRDLVHRVPIGLYRLGPDGTFADANPALASMLGYPRPDALIGRRLWDLFCRPEFVEVWKGQLERNGRLEGLEYEMRRADGRIVWVRDYCTAARDREGRIWRYEGSLEDVTARHEAEQALAQERNLLRTILDNAVDYVFVKDRASRFILTNPAHLRILGARSLDEVVGKTDFDFFPRELAERYYADEQEVIATGRPLLNRLEKAVDPQGNEYWLLTTKTPLWDASGNTIGIVGISRDITELRRVEEERNRLVMAVEQAADGVLLVDSTRRIRFANRACGNILARSPASLIGQDALSSGCFELDREQRREIGTQLQQQGWWSGRLRGRRLDGTEIVCEASVSRFSPEDSPAESNYVVVLHDLTRIELLERQLEQSRRLEAVGRLAGGIAHDFNNVLTAISGYADLILLDLEANDPIRQDVEEIKKAASRAASLTRQLLAFGRKLVLQPRVLNLNELVENLTKMLRRLIGEDIELVVDLDPELGNIHADPAQIEQVVVNLVVNARDAMPHGGRLVIETSNVALDEEYARTHVDARPGNYVMLAVSDTGHGMDEATKAHIFEPFFSTKGKDHAGLGLAQVYGIVKQSGGHIWVYSEPGHGTTFKIYLPRVDAPAEKPVQPEEAKAVLEGTETVLLVEDDDTVRALTRSVLRRFGYTVLEAKSPGDALLISERHAGPIHVLVTDVVMPGMNGRELAERLRTQRPDLRVIYCSGYTDNLVTVQGLLEEGVDFVPKPFHPEALLRKVRDALDQP